MQTLDEFIAECKAKDEAATNGPWYSDEGTVTFGELKHGVGENHLCHVDHNPEHEVMYCSQDVVDGNYIKFARTAMPKLVKMVECLKSKLHPHSYYEELARILKGEPDGTE